MNAFMEVYNRSKNRRGQKPVHNAIDVFKYLLHETFHNHIKLKLLLSLLIVIFRILHILFFLPPVENPAIEIHDVTTGYVLTIVVLIFYYQKIFSMLNAFDLLRIEIKYIRNGQLDKFRYGEL